MLVHLTSKLSSMEKSDRNASKLLKQMKPYLLSMGLEDM